MEKSDMDMLHISSDGLERYYLPVQKNNPILTLLLDHIKNVEKKNRELEISLGFYNKENALLGKIVGKAVLQEVKNRVWKK